MSDDTKPCPVCGETIKAAAIKCRFCNTDLAGMRLASQCLLRLRSSDTSFSTVVIFGIPKLETLADTLRECSLRERTRRRVTTFVQA